MPTGISRTALLISAKNPPRTFRLRPQFGELFVVGGISLVESTDTRTDPIEHTAPTQKAAKTQ
jgi:hypothetical protein